jgi:hypothetical protein
MSSRLLPYPLRGTGPPGLPGGRATPPHGTGRVMVHRGEGEKEKRRKIARGGEEGRGEGERGRGEGRWGEEPRQDTMYTVEKTRREWRPSRVGAYSVRDNRVGR